MFFFSFTAQVRVLGTGLTLFLFLPAAFVDVDTSQLEVNWRQCMDHYIHVSIIN